MKGRSLALIVLLIAAVGCDGSSRRRGGGGGFGGGGGGNNGGGGANTPFDAGVIVHDAGFVDGAPVPHDAGFADAGFRPDATSNAPDATAAGRDAASSNEESLGHIQIFEQHGAADFVSAFAYFLPVAANFNLCATTLDGCQIQSVPECGSCPDGFACGWDANCQPQCTRTCNLTCEGGTLCMIENGNPVCRPPPFTAGRLNFSGTSAPFSLDVPYAASGELPAAAFSSGASIQVSASGAPAAGFLPFSETFNATTRLERSGSISPAQFYGDAPFTVRWAPGNDSVQVRLSAAGGTATCPANDASGSYTVPRSVVQAIVGGGSFATLFVERSRTEVRQNKQVRGPVPNVQVPSQGRLELRTQSTHLESVRGCLPVTQEYCPGTGTCELTLLDPSNCGGCGIQCGARDMCTNGECIGGDACLDCRNTARAGRCASEDRACDQDVGCATIRNCIFVRENCYTAYCETQFCGRDTQPGEEVYDDLERCMRSECSRPCQGR